MSHFIAPPAQTLRSLLLMGIALIVMWSRPALSLENLEPIEDTSLLIEHIDDNKLRVHGREWDARIYCTPESIANGDLVRAYRLQSPEGESLVVHCPGMLDGDLNRVSVFTAGQKPRSMTVKPAASSHSIDEATLKESVAHLMAAKAAAPARASATSGKKSASTAKGPAKPPTKSKSESKKSAPSKKKKPAAKKPKRATA
jgi:hypothetical protein